MTVLARVTGDPTEPRGPDVMCSVEAPREWLVEGATIEVRLPRLLCCGRCEGGGCDQCGRRGAFDRDAAGAPELVEATLPAQDVLAAVRLRLPGCGARDTSEAGLPSGHLLLTVLPRAISPDDVGAGLRRIDAGRSKSRARIWALLLAFAKLLTRWLSR